MKKLIVNGQDTSVETSDEVEPGDFILDQIILLIVDTDEENTYTTLVTRRQFGIPTKRIYDAVLDTSPDVDES